VINKGIFMEWVEDVIPVFTETGIFHRFEQLPLTRMQRIEVIEDS